MMSARSGDTVWVSRDANELPAVFAFVQGKSSTRSASLGPADPASGHFNAEVATP
jgi:hypothetical protein